MQVQKLVKNEILTDIKANGLWKMLLVTFAFGMLWAVILPTDFLMNDYMTEYFRGFYFVSIFMSGYLLTNNIEKGSIKYQISSVSERTTIWLTKLIAVSVYSVMFWLVCCLFEIVIIIRGAVPFSLTEMLSPKWLLYYFLTDVFLVSCAYMLSLFIKNKYVVEVIMILFWGGPYMIMPMFMYFDGAEKYFTESVKDKLCLYPAYNILNWVVDERFTLISFLITVGYIVLFNFISLKKFKGMEFK